MNAARVSAAVLLSYLLLIFFLLRGNTPVSFPFHHDDYDNLAQTWALVRWLPIRPVSSFLIQVFSAAGPTFYYLSLHVLIMLYASLALWFLARLFDVRKPAFLPLFAVAAAALSYEHVIEYSKYTGLITNLLSGVFGAGAMCLLVSESDREKPRWAALAGIALLAVLSFWSKEDFVAPVLLVAAFLMGEKWFRGTQGETWRKWALACVAILFSLAVALVIYNRFRNSPFTQATTEYYKRDLSPLSIIVQGWWYVRATPGATAAFLVQLSLLLVNLAGLVPWRRMLLYQALIGIVALPYLCLPNHLNGFYGLNWTIFQAGGLILLLKVQKYRIPVYAALLIAGTAVVVITQPGRNRFFGWYQETANVNRNIVATLEQNRSRLIGKPVIAVEGAPVFCPWFSTDGSFLRNRYGYQNRWIVRVPRDSDYMRVTLERLHSNVLGWVRTVAQEDEPLPDNVPVLTLGPDGKGSVRDAQPAASAAR